MLEGLAHGLGEWRWGGVVAIDLEAKWLAVGVSEGQQEGVGRRRSAVFDGQA